MGQCSTIAVRGDGPLSSDKMTTSHDLPLIAVDIGNNRTKFGLFRPESLRRLAPRDLPEPASTFYLSGADADLQPLDGWLAADDRQESSRAESREPRVKSRESRVESGESSSRLSTLDSKIPTLAWWIGSVNRPSATRLIDWLRTRRPQDSITLLAAGDLPLKVALERPDMVGIDRLLDALAANRLRRSGRPAVVVDVGTAITVDLVSPEGAFLGGSILPGIAMSARALHEFTDMLPLLDISELSGPPPALGASTTAAVQSGLFWGAVGAIRQLVAELTKSLPGEPDVFLTGGAGPAVAGLLGPSARHVPHLTLAGIALAARGNRDGGRGAGGGEELPGTKGQ